MHYDFSAQGRTGNLVVVDTFKMSCHEGSPGRIVHCLQDIGNVHDEIKTFLNAGGGSVRITLSSGSTTGIKQTLADRKASNGKYSLDGRKLKHTPSKGVYLENGKKIVK